MTMFLNGILKLFILLYTVYTIYYALFKLLIILENYLQINQFCRLSLLAAVLQKKHTKPLKQQPKTIFFHEYKLNI